MRMQDASQGGHLDFGLEFWFPDFCQKAPRGPIWIWTSPHVSSRSSRPPLASAQRAAQKNARVECVDGGGGT